MFNFVEAENSPVMEKESTDGVTVVLDEQNIGSPKRIVLRESKLASEVFEIKRKDSGEGNKENELLSEVYSDAQPLNVAEPVGKIKITSGCSLYAFFFYVFMLTTIVGDVMAIGFFIYKVEEIHRG